MSNFNSREVVEKLSTLLNLHAYMSPGDDLITEAVSILDSALESAKREERKNTIKWMIENMDTEQCDSDDDSIESIYKLMNDSLVEKEAPHE